MTEGGAKHKSGGQPRRLMVGTTLETEIILEINSQYLFQLIRGNIGTAYDNHGALTGKSLGLL